MNCRKVEITVHSAEDLEKVRKYHKMKVYAAVTLGGDPRTIKYSPPDKHNEINPAWNHTFKYTIGEMAMYLRGVMLVIKLYCKVSLGKDRYVGEIYVSLSDLFARGHWIYGTYFSSVTESHAVRRGSIISTGLVNFTCRFGETYVIKKPPFWKKALVSAGMFILRVTLTSAIGIPMPFDIPFFMN